MAVLLVAVTILLGAAVVVLALRVQADRARRKQRGLFGPWPIATIPLDRLDPVFEVDELGPTLRGEVTFVGRGKLAVTGGTSDTEAWVLAALARDARLMFEFGTCTGKTAYLWARNSPPDARVITITLAPEDHVTYHRDSADSAHETSAAIAESAFTRFRYSGTPVEAKIEQLFGDSKQLDVSPWEGRCDLVFVDGSHAYSYVVSDSERAMRLVRPGGLVLWHDYGDSRDVERALNELSRRYELVHVQGTSFIAWRRPTAA